MKNFSRKDVELIHASGFFDANWYIEQYPDVKALGMDPVEHYLWLGARLKRNPSPEFDTSSYLNVNPDVANAGVNPLLHYVRYGLSEKRAVYRVNTTFKHKNTKSVVPHKIQRKLSAWDKQRENSFNGQIDKILKDNPGYFERIPVSVIIPTFNRMNTISKAIDSVLLQSFENWELLVVDDGSSDDTVAEIQSFTKDPRVKLVELSHVGVAAARNAGLERALGDFVFYLDSDNKWEKDYLKTMVTFMAIGNLDAAYCGIKVVDDEENIKAYRGDEFNWNECYIQNYVDMNCFGHRRIELFETQFDISLKRLVDWDFILRYTFDKRTSFAPFCGVTYYDGENGARITHTEYHGSELKAAESRIRQKHASRIIESADRGEIRPKWSDFINSLPKNAINDEHSKRLVGLGESIIDWTATRNKALQKNLVSIIILCFNNSSISANCIQSVLNDKDLSDYKLEILAIDNNSSDDTGEVLNEMSRTDSRVRVIKNSENLMFSLGNNLGIAEAHGEYTVLLNNDTLVRPGWLVPLINSLRLDPSIGVAGPKLLYPDNTLQCGGLVFNSKSKIPYHVYRGFDKDDPAVNKSRVFQALTGACMAWRTADLVRLRGFDPSFINGCEDLDICFRLRSVLRKRALYNPRSEILHLESKSVGRGRFIARNREKFVARWSSKIRADDMEFFHNDGFAVKSYTKPGNEPDGETASYVPMLENSTPPHRGDRLAENGADRKLLNIGFSTIWHARGVSFLTEQLASSLTGEKFQTHIFARWESEKFLNTGPIHHPRVFNAGDDPSEEVIVEWAKEKKLDAIVFMEVHPKDWKRVAAIKSLGIPVICYEHLDVLRKQMVSRYSIFDMFLFNCFYSRELFLSFFPEKPSLMLPWGTLPSESAESSIEKTTDYLRFVHVSGWGGINNRKNTDLLIRAFNRAQTNKAELHVYTQSPIRNYGEDIVNICKIARNIIVHEGTIHDIRDAYRDKSMLLWPSKREGVGLPILEALVHGLPVLVPDGYMMKQWIVPDEHGIVCKGRPMLGQMALPELEVDEDDLLSKILNLIENPQQVHELRRLVQRDRSHWEWSWQAKVFNEQLRSILENGGYRPQDDLSYLPPDVLEFEYRRRTHDNI